MMNARPLFAGMTCRNSTRASNPPADAPIPTTQGSESRTTVRRRLDLAAFVGLARVEAMVLAQQYKARVYGNAPNRACNLPAIFLRGPGAGVQRLQAPRRADLRQRVRNRSHRPAAFPCLR